MEDIFTNVWAATMEDPVHMVAMHKAVIDRVYEIPLSMAEFTGLLEAEEPRFEGSSIRRLGGGGINFAIVAASLGHPRVTFAGFLGVAEKRMIRQLCTRFALRLKIKDVEIVDQHNTIVELNDGNFILKRKPRETVSMPITSLVDRVRQEPLQPRDWLAFCSAFHLPLVEPLLEAGTRIFVDTGYNYARFKDGLLGRLLDMIKAQPPPDLVLAANEREFYNLGVEMGYNGPDAIGRGHRVADAVAERCGVAAKIIVHTARWAALFEPGQSDVAIAPTLDIRPRRRTNAGDTFAPAFLMAYDATGNGPLSCAIANAVAAKRLADDELPTRDNVVQFLRTVRLRAVQLPGARTVGVDELRETARTLRSRRLATAAAK